MQGEHALKHAAATAVAVVVLVASGSAQAYVGPGAGISLIGATVGLLTALAVAIGCVVMWTVRALLGRGAGSAGRPQDAAPGAPPELRADAGPDRAAP